MLVYRVDWKTNMLEKKKLETEYMRVRASRCELELKILEREDEIKRLQAHIVLQCSREVELEKQIGEMQ